MADSSSVQEQSAHTSLLNIKQNQKLILDLASFKYNAYMLPIVECLKYSPLVHALTKVECVPMSLLSKAYSSASYVQTEERILFEIFEHKASISKARFCSLLGLTYVNSMVNPDSISTAQIIEMFYQMGYTDPIIAIAKFNESNLPPQWNRLLTLIIKAFSIKSH